jgi:hypothetical protein
MDIKTGYEDVNWTHVGQDRAQWRTVFNMVMIFFLYKVGNFFDWEMWRFISLKRHFAAWS